VRGLTLAIDNRGGPVLPVRNVSFELRAGETLAIVGESGSGKTLTVLALMGLLPAAIRPVQGEALFTRRDGTTVDLLTLGRDQMRRLRGDQIAMVFQDPTVSLNPLLRVGDQVMEPIHAHGAVPAAEARARAARLLRDVGLPDPEQRIAPIRTSCPAASASAS
jgi:ABC-type glutathione transport system ATPase component